MTRHFLAALLLVFALFGLGYQLRRTLWLQESPPRAASRALTQQPTTQAPVATLLEQTGIVEIRKQPGVAWQSAPSNAQLDSDSAIRTGSHARVKVAIGANVQVELGESSEISLSAIGAALFKLRLEAGRASASVGPESNARLVVHVRGSDAIAETPRGKFSLLRADDGQLTVAASQGDVALETPRQRIVIAAGRQSVVPVTGDPSAPARIPPSLLLKVAQNERLQLSRRETAISGKTTPGAVVDINGISTATGHSGEFLTRVPLAEGANTLRVRATDALGRTQERLVAVSVDTRAPKLGAKLEW